MKITKQNIPALVVRIEAILVGIFVGFFLYNTGLSMVRALYFGILLTLFLLALRSPAIAIFLLFLTVPIHYIAGIEIDKTIIRLQHIFGALCIVAIFYYLFLSEKKEAITKRIATPIDFPLFLLIVIMIVSIIQTIYLPDNPTVSLNRIYNYPWIKGIIKIMLLGFPIGVFYVIQATLQTKEDIKKWLTRYVAIGGIVALYGLVAFVIFILGGYYLAFDGYNAIVDNKDDLPRIKATEQEPSFFGFYLMSIIPIVLALSVRQIREKTEFYKKNVLLWFLGIMLVALFLSGSRAAILALLFSLLTVFFLHKENESFSQYIKSIIDYCKQYYKHFFYIITEAIKTIVTSRRMSAISLLCLILIGFFVTLNLEEIESKSSQIVREGILSPTLGIFSSNYGKYWSTRTRLLTYKYALDAFQQHPWLGIGYENYNFYTGNKVYQNLLPFNITWPEVNNYPLKVLTEQGIIGFLAFLFLVIVFFYSMFDARGRTKDPFLKALLEGYIALFVGFAIILLFTSNIMKLYIWVSMAFVIAIIKIVHEKEREETTEKLCT